MWLKVAKKCDQIITQLNAWKTFMWSEIRNLYIQKTEFFESVILKIFSPVIHKNLHKNPLLLLNKKCKFLSGLLKEGFVEKYGLINNLHIFHWDYGITRKLIKMFKLYKDFFLQWSGHGEKWLQQ